MTALTPVAASEQKTTWKMGVGIEWVVTRR
jgi:hypothetical protein